MNIATHPGIVTDVKKGRVSVQIESVSACASCQAHSQCGFAESKNKTVEVPDAHWQQYSVGQNVTVRIDQSRGLLAVWIAYLLPALILIAAAVGLSLTGLPEWAVILSVFAFLGIYILVLYLSRKKIESRFTLTIEELKIES
jgi:sigma-E factor negative regulatory protein RseC